MRYTCNMKTIQTFFTLLFIIIILMNSSCSSTAPSVAEAPSSGYAKEDKSTVETGLGGTESEVLITEDVRESSKPKARSEVVSASASGRKNTESGLKAGLVDDNTQYNYFLDFLSRYEHSSGIRAVPVHNRIMLTVLDEQNHPIPNALLSIYNEQQIVTEQIQTYADGTVLLTPPLDAAGLWTIEAEVPEHKQRISFDPQGLRNIELQIATKPRQSSRWVPTPVPLDMVFILDTTGSMGEEIERLKETIEIIRDNLDLATPKPKLRFGLVLYRDRGDDYITQSFPLTENLKQFQSYLAKAKADGGGDTPEDLEAALAAAINKNMGWDPKGARLVFIITDAPAHTYTDGVPYNESAEQARSQAIKIHSIGTGGLPIDGEYQLRQIAQRTRGKYIFLTYGEKGESEGGAPGAVSHHTGSNWTADRLEAIIIRLAKEEISLLSGETVSVPSDDYYEAKAIPDRDKDSILDELFSETLSRLLDYAAAPISKASRVSLVPLSFSEFVTLDEKKNAELFSSRLLQAAIRTNRFTLVERNDLQAILQELELSLSAISDPEGALQVGKLLGAEYLILPNMVSLAYTKEDDPAWEVYLRLIRVSTGEILSVSRAKISQSLSALD